ASDRDDPGRAEGFLHPPQGRDKVPRRASELGSVCEEDGLRFRRARYVLLPDDDREVSRRRRLWHLEIREGPGKSLRRRKIVRMFGGPRGEDAAAGPNLKPGIVRPLRDVQRFREPGRRSLRPLDEQDERRRQRPTVPGPDAAAPQAAPGLDLEHREAADARGLVKRLLTRQGPCFARCTRVPSPRTPARRRSAGAWPAGGRS